MKAVDKGEGSLKLLKVTTVRNVTIVKWLPGRRGDGGVNTLTSFPSNPLISGCLLVAELEARGKETHLSNLDRLASWGTEQKWRRLERNMVDKPGIVAEPGFFFQFLFSLSHELVLP